MTLLTRRAMTTAALAGTFLPGLARAQGRKPIVIGHRGCSGERPEHTVLAYERAIAQGCDFIEPDLVPTKDGHLVVRHENEIGGTTDIAGHPEFATRKTTKTIDGQSLTGWFPTYFASIGLPIEGRMLDALKRNDLDSATAPVFVQCFEVTPLKTLRLRTRAKLVQLIDDVQGPADLPSVTNTQMLTARGLREIATYADGVGPHQAFVIPRDAETLLPATSLVIDAHAVGLQVHPWTVRAENYFLPASLRGGDATAADFLAQHGDVGPLFKALYAAGVDGIFSDFPGLAVAARG
jgi:glycerophosphoryl diester phosphodiesterase